MDHGLYGRAEAKSLALYQAIRKKLDSLTPEQQHQALEQARSWTHHMRLSMPEVPYLEEWEERLQKSIDSKTYRKEMFEWMLSTDDHTVTMRSCSPFSHILTTKERTAVLMDFSRDHEINNVGIGETCKMNN